MMVKIMSDSKRIKEKVHFSVSILAGAVHLLFLGFSFLCNVLFTFLIIFLLDSLSFTNKIQIVKNLVYILFLFNSCIQVTHFAFNHALIAGA